MSTFVLVHGAWHDGSAWTAVLTHLTRDGHTAFGPTVAGHGPGGDKAVTHTQSTQSIVDFIVQQHLTEVVLLGHGAGGTIIAKVVEQVPDRMQRLIFWNAFVLHDGESILDNVPPHYRTLFAQIAGAAPDRAVMLPFPLWREAFMNDADLALAQASYAHLSPAPYQFPERLDLKTFYDIVRSGRVACSYLNCTDDIALPQGAWGWHPRMLNRLGLCRLVQMPGGHEVLFSNPAGLAAKIIEAGRD